MVGGGNWSWGRACRCEAAFRKGVTIRVGEDAAVGDKHVDIEKGWYIGERYHSGKYCSTTNEILYLSLSQVSSAASILVVRRMSDMPPSPTQNRVNAFALNRSMELGILRPPVLNGGVP
jgi:hypothetical protein